MAGGGGSVFSPQVQSQKVSSGSKDCFLSESNRFSGEQAMLRFEDVHGGGAKSCRSFFQSFDIMEGDLDDYLQQPEKRRRLTADQVRLLEKSFKLENKLEPERKAQLAKDLGLQPRQIAIWFQNRRARGKTKQIEKDYDTLQASYNALKADYDALVKEIDQLKDQVHDLANNLVQNPTVGSVSKEEAPKSPNILPTKHEEICSGKSDVLDSDSPHYADCGHSSLLEPGDASHVFEPDQSDISQDEEDSLMPAHILFPDHSTGPPATNAFGFEFSADDPTFWSWSY